MTVTGGVYPDKIPIKITKFDDIQLGKLASVMAINEKGQQRTVDTLILLVNPSDYFSKVLPAIQRPAPGGGFVSTLPFAIDVIQSAAVPVNKAVFGMAKLYFAGAGIEKDGRILFSDEYRFLEDERVYLIKTYAHGFAVDNNAFVVLDITNLQPSYYKVEVMEAYKDPENADLADLRVGGHTLTPEFVSETTEYTLTTTDASNTVQATLADTTATVDLTYNDKPIANGSRVTWETGAGNVIKAVVKDGEATKTYTITVTKSE